MDSKEVMIYINGMQFAEYGERQEPVEVIAPGLYYKKNGSHYLLFDEVEESSEGISKNVFKFRKSYLEVNRKGVVSTQMIFEENKKTKAFYGTPFGVLNIGIATTLVDLKEKDDQIELTANYALEINDQFVSDCCISLKAKPKSSNFSLSS